MKSPIKWVGGKRKEIKFFEEFIPPFETYVEPFFGGGALYWHLQPERSIINDINKHLINFYKTITNNVEEVNVILNTYSNDKDSYKRKVEELNKEEYKNDIEHAAIFHYLNKTGFSGQWRENSKGYYNIPFGKYSNENFKYVDPVYGMKLKNAKIYNHDFKDIFDIVKDDENAFLFLDPPYLDCGTLYTANQKFDDIYKYIVYYLYHSKCKVMLVVKSTEYIEEIFKNYIIHRYDVSYKNNAKSTKKNEHLVICNY